MLHRASQPILAATISCQRAITAPLALTLVLACSRGSEPGRGVPAASTASASFAAPPAASAPPPPAPTNEAAAPTAPAEAPVSWLGVALDPAIRLERSVQLESGRDPRVRAVLQVPAGWRALELGNGMSENTEVCMLFPPDRSAVAILLVYEPGVWHETLVNGEAQRWLGVSGGVTRFDGWEPPSPIEIGDARTPGARVRGSGALMGKPAELWQVRRRFPSPATGKHALVVAAAIHRSAPPARRAELLACLASFAPTPEK